MLYNGSFLCTLITMQGQPLLRTITMTHFKQLFSFQEPHPLMLSAHRSPTHSCSQHTEAPPTHALSTQKPHPLMLSAHRSPTHSCSQHTEAPPTHALSTQKPHPLMLGHKSIANQIFIAAVFSPSKRMHRLVIKDYSLTNS